MQRDLRSGVPRYAVNVVSCTHTAVASRLSTAPGRRGPGASSVPIHDADAKLFCLDVSVVTYGEWGTGNITPALRGHDRLLVRDNNVENIGFAAGHNSNVRLGNGELICFVNPDGELTSECLDALENTMLDESIVACEADSKRVNVQRLPNGDLVWIAATCMVVRRQAFQSVGGFDERFFMYHEDYELSYRLRPLGRFVLVPEATFPHDWDRPRGFMRQHRLSRNHLVVFNRYEKADPILMFREGGAAIRQDKDWRTGVGKITGTLDYLARGRRWTDPPPPF